MDVNIKQVTGVDPIPLQPVEISSIDVIKRIEQIAPAAVHIKELNQIDPLTVESLRVDAARNIEPLRVDRLNVTHLPMVNLSLGTLPQVDINLRRAPPLEIGLHQEFDLSSRYMVHTRILGVELARLEIHGSTRVRPRDCARRETSHEHERSFPDVAAAGNPAIPTRRVESCAVVETRTADAPAAIVPTAGLASVLAAAGNLARAAVSAGSTISSTLSAGAPRFNYSVGRAMPAGDGSSSLSAGD
jgi:hypothetical protein